MARYVLRRIGSALVILWVIISITFVLMHAIPGGPFTSEKKLPPQAVSYTHLDVYKRQSY